MPPLPYGAWPSPITPALMTTSLVDLGAPVLHGGDLYWLETRADQGGRTTLWRRRDGAAEELTPDHYVRSRAHEYGGGEYAVGDGVVVFSDFSDGRLYLLDLLADDTAAVPLTGPGAVRYADLRVHVERNLVLAVREDHRGPGEAVTALVAIPLDADGTGQGEVLCSGADFYATPEISADGRLAWVEWDHPNMPWDGTRLKVGRLTGSTVAAVEEIAGGPTESAVQPRWAGDRLVFASDRSGWWNIYLASAGPAPVSLCPREASFAAPQWTFGQRPYAVVDSDRLLCTYRQNGRMRLGTLRLSNGRFDDIDLPGEPAALGLSGGQATTVLSHQDRPPELVTLDIASGEVVVIRGAGELPFDREWISVARPMSWPSEDGEVHGWFYPPTNPAVEADPAERPPLLTISHGGPTGFSPADFRLVVQFWTTRGVAVLDVNYGGSAGYGRAYRQRLRHRWGIVDVRDCAQGAEAMGRQSLVDPSRLAIMGGSAGGYTTLRALTATRTFAAGISLYGVGDLERLARDTHKFESRYLDGLIGPYPQARSVYRERSPIDHVDQLAAPILLLQGADDKVVPPSQAETMAEAARAKGLPVALVIYPGEGHGFRRAETIQASYSAQLSFLGQIFGFEPSGDVPRLAIENL